MLEIKNLEISYGAIRAVRGISFHVDDGEIVTIVGSNGAGKSTTMNAIAGIKEYKKGQILLDGVDISHAGNDKLVRAGIVLVPEGRQVFPRMSVEENLDIGAYLYTRERAENGKRMQMVYDMFPRLYERRTQLAGTLSGGEQQMLAIGRGLMTRPKILMLDEPSLGLAPIIVYQIFQMIRQINETDGISILLVEQNARMAMGIASRTYVLDEGKIVLDGPSRLLRDDPRVKEAYL